MNYSWEVQSDAPYRALIDATTIEITPSGDLVFYLHGAIIRTFAARHWHSCERQEMRNND